MVVAYSVSSLSFSPRFCNYSFLVNSLVFLLSLQHIGSIIVLTIPLTKQKLLVLTAVWCSSLPSPQDNSSFVKLTPQA